MVTDSAKMKLNRLVSEFWKVCDDGTKSKVMSCSTSKGYEGPKINNWRRGMHVERGRFLYYKNGGHRSPIGIMGSEWQL